MDVTAFGPYALNVRTNISSYGPLARLIRAYYAIQFLSISIGLSAQIFQTERNLGPTNFKNEIRLPVIYLFLRNILKV